MACRFFLSLTALCGAGLALSVAACGEETGSLAPGHTPVETATGGAETTPRPQEFIVAAAHPAAVEAGLEMLEQGGSAVDAAVAVAVTLSLVEPMSSGIGGGAFLMHYDSDGKTVSAYDGREIAPASAGPDLFLDDSGAPIGFREAQIGGHSVGVPGLIAMLEMAHEAHGNLPWADVFEPAIRLAEEGVPIGPKLHRTLTRIEEQPGSSTFKAHYYDAAGTPWPIGHVLKNPDFAATLRLIQANGAEAFYNGPITDQIVGAVSDAEFSPVPMTREDFAAYAPKTRDAVCGPYRSWTVCGMPPPTSGGIAVLQMLGVLERFDIAALDPLSADAVHLFAEAGRLAFADRALYLGDPDVIPVPTEGLIDQGYLRSRAALVSEDSSLGRAEAGTPPGLEQSAHWAPSEAEDAPGTSHFSIVDAEGNAVSMTSTIESTFGSRIMVGGFMLNNELTDFDFRPTRDGRPVANAPGPRKRPRSSMSPTLILDQDRDLYALTGSPGGSRIIGYTAQSILGLTDWQLPVAEVVALPHYLSRNGPVTQLEEDRGLEGLITDLESRGHEIRLTPMPSGIHAIRVMPDGYEGAADPRQEGIARGR